MTGPRYVSLTKSGIPHRATKRGKLYTYRCATDGREYGYSKRLFGNKPSGACHELVPWPSTMEVAYRAVKGAYLNGIADLDAWVEEVPPSTVAAAPYYLQDWLDRSIPNRDELRQALSYARAWGTLRPLPEMPDITKRTDLQHTGFNYGRKRK